MKKHLDQTLTPQQRAEALVSEMTVEEMAGQLRYDAPAIERLGIPAYNWWNEGLHGLARSGVATMFHLYFLAKPYCIIPRRLSSSQQLQRKELQLRPSEREQTALPRCRP